MAPISSFTWVLGLVALGARRTAADCLSFGMDFQDGGSYFQNNASTDPFTFVSQFEGKLIHSVAFRMLLTRCRLQQ